MKKYFILVTLTLFLCAFGTFVPPVMADNNFVPLAPIPGLTQVNGSNVTADQVGIAGFLNNLYIYAIGAAVMLAIIMIIWGGLEYSMSESITAKGAGKERIRNALFGLVLVLSPALVFTIINPKILNLNINMPALNTPTGTAGPVGSCSDPNGCSPSSPPEGIRLFTPNSYQGLLPCKGTDCSETVAACATNGGVGVTGTSQLVCGDAAGGDVSRQRFYGGAVSGTATCYSGSSVVVLCTLSKPGLVCRVSGWFCS